MSTQESLLTDAPHGEPSEVVRATAQAFKSETELNCWLCYRMVVGGAVRVAENLYCSIECANVAPRNGLPVAGRYLG
jgi:hypothetical protein